MTCYTSNTHIGGVRLTRAPFFVERSIRAIGVIGLLMIMTTTAAYSWSNPGHMAVALAAYNRLDPNVRARVDTLIALNPKVGFWQTKIPANVSAAERKRRLFMIAATWADQIKSDGHISDGTNGGNVPPADGTGAANLGYSDTKMRKYWHFIDLPFSPDGTPTVNPPTPNAETQIDLFRSVLNSNAPDHLKSYDLVWLLHLVGDVHQPLHCAARFTSSDRDGDDGGNGVRVSCTDCPEKLHSFWDGVVGSTNDLRAGVRRAITVVSGLPTPPVSEVNNLQTRDWISEGFALAKSKVYKNPPIKNGTGVYNLGSNYRSTAITLGNKRIALAGARLAKILNSELQ